MIITVSDDGQQMASAAAQGVASYIQNNPGKLLCFAAGDTPLQMLAELIALQNGGQINLSSMYYVGLDEWVGIGYETSGSCVQVMRDNFYTPAHIPEDRMRLWDGHSTDLRTECRKMDSWISSHGGIGLTVLGIGMNGHIGFNEPGTPWDHDCRTVDLDSVTAQVGPKYFGGNACPTVGVTVGVKQLLAAERFLLIANGKHKAPIVRKALMKPASEEVPASCLQTHGKCSVFIDRELFINL